MTVFNPLFNNHPLHLMHQAISALRHAWRIAQEQHIGLDPDLIRRSLSVIEQARQLPANQKTQRVLMRLQDQLQGIKLVPAENTPKKWLTQTIEPFHLRLNPEQSPWFCMETDSPVPELLQTLGSDWRQRIKEHKNDPISRLQLAWQMLPYRTAFNEAAIALRAILREKTHDERQTLNLLYWLAAVHSFISIDPETPSGDLIASYLPGTTLLKMEVNYSELGLNELPLLNTTEKNRMETLWGKTEQHSSLQKMYPNSYQEYLLVATNKKSPVQ